MTTPGPERHALVTGASRGIGLVVARRLMQQGARVTLMGRGEASLQKACAELGGGDRVGFVTGDVSQGADVQAAFDQARQRFGLISILVNNAGQASSERFDRLDEARWQQMIAVNLTGTFHCIQAALPDMVSAKWGRIVNVASTAGLIGYTYTAAYCASKHGVVGLTRAMALEAAAKGVTVNAVCPGFTETDLGREAIANISARTGRSQAEATAALAAFNPQKRLVQPDEVANAAVWLCLPASAAMNGQAIAVAGGEVT